MHGCMPMEQHHHHHHRHHHDSRFDPHLSNLDLCLDISTKYQNWYNSHLWEPGRFGHQHRTSTNGLVWDVEKLYTSKHSENTENTLEIFFGSIKKSSICMCFLCVFERAFANKRYLETVKVKSPGFSKVLAGSSSRLVGIHYEIKVNVTCCFRDVYIYRG